LFDLLSKFTTVKGRLDPFSVVEADRQTVDAILRAQAMRERSHIWIDRVVAFLLGVASSIVASLIYGAVRRVINRRLIEKKEAAQPLPGGDV
jgi:hypothetical protein